MTIAEPNVVWCSDDEPPTHYMDGRDAVLLPVAEVARRGFRTPEPQRLVRLSGGKIKLFVPKGPEAVRAGASRGKLKTRGKK